MFHGKSNIHALHLKLSSHEGELAELDEILNDPAKDVLSVDYAHMGEYAEKWALVVYADSAH